ncbi:hypothetical protein F4860DRAFT_520734 [Xylaria cubensis]|nr:hypothetical protein F4860DRAFT_520734 [Xylaria cubensis]
MWHIDFTSNGLRVVCRARVHPKKLCFNARMPKDLRDRRWKQPRSQWQGPRGYLKDAFPDSSASILSFTAGTFGAVRPPKPNLCGGPICVG